MLLENIENLHDNFLKKYPDENISLTSFKKLRPKECIPVGAKGTHNVYVCKIHGNIRLKLKGLQEEFIRKNLDYETNYRDCLEKMTCSNPSPDCYLSKCMKCPGTKNIAKNLKTTLKTHNIKSITYNEWLTTDRFVFNKHSINLCLV